MLRCRRDLCVVVWAASDVFWIRRTRAAAKELDAKYRWDLGLWDFLVRICLSSFSINGCSLVPLIGGRWYISPQLAVYTTYTPLIYCLLGDYISPYHLLREPETAVDSRTIFSSKSDTSSPHPNSQCYIGHTKHRIKTSELSVSFTIFAKKTPFWSKIRLSRGFSPRISSFFHILSIICFFTFSLILSSFSPFFDVFSSSPEAFKAASHQAASNGNVPALRHFLRVKPECVAGETSVSSPLASKNGWIACSGGVVGGRCQKKFSRILKFGVNRNFDYFSMLGFELPDY